MDRKLASLQRILKLEPIEGADRIELATILGWSCVVKKGQFKEGDIVIFCEIDSLIPKCIWSNFLWKEGDTKEKYRLKTCKMKGHISQGLVLPTSILPVDIFQVIHEGLNVTEYLGIEKYVPYIPTNLQAEILGDFPSFIPKTDQTRLQSYPNILNIAHGKSVTITEKLDGCSTTYFIKNNHFGVCSRNIELKENEHNIYWKMAKKYNIEEKLREYYSKFGNIAIQGEIIGQGIQSNKYKLEDNKLFIFNIYDIEYYNYVDDSLMESWCCFLGLDVVPDVDIIDLDGSVEEWIELSKGNSKINPNVLREGIVVKGINEEIYPSFGRLSFKVINPDFLIKHNE
jgi:RNA ligase (TIGR02306 family)